MSLLIDQREFKLANTEEDYGLAAAFHVAQRSSILGYQTGAVIYANDGSRHYGWSHRSEIRYSRTPFSCHAELHAINRTPKAKLAGATIYVVTIRRKSMNVVSGKPCEVCADILDKVGIERVVHS
jgi:deoxycytidylate deaminase